MCLQLNCPEMFTNIIQSSGQEFCSWNQSPGFVFIIILLNTLNIVCIMLSTMQGIQNILLQLHFDNFSLPSQVESTLNYFHPPTKSCFSPSSFRDLFSSISFTKPTLILLQPMSQIKCLILKMLRGK